MSIWSDCNDLMAVSKSKDVAGKNANGSPLIGWLFRPTTLLQILIVAIGFSLWPEVTNRLPSLDDRPEYKLSFQQIRILPAPDRPVPSNLLEQVQKLSELPDELSVLDENLTTEIARAFRRHPWVSKVVRVKKSFPADVTVELEYRQPIAMVKTNDGLIPIDLQGTVLPTVDFSTGEIGRYPVIQFGSTKPVTRAGTSWEDPALLAAAELANYLKDKWSVLKLEAITVNRGESTKSATRDLTLDLIGRGGSRILWGRAPSVDYPGELEPGQKVRRLEKYLSDFGDYVRPGGPYVIDIRHWQEISRHAIAVPAPVTKPAKSTRDEARRPNSDSRKKSRN